jgi:hypothetical protein
MWETSEILLAVRIRSLRVICRGLLCRQAEDCYGSFELTSSISICGNMWIFLFDSAYSTDLQINLFQIVTQCCEASHATGTELHSHVLSNSMEKLTVALLVKNFPAFYTRTS